MKTLLFSLLLTVAFAFQSQAQDRNDLSAKKNGQVKVEVFPNPATNYLTVDLSKLSLQDPKIEIRNIIGSKMTFRSEKLGRNKQRLDVQDYPPGYYLVLVRDDKTKFQQTVRFSKK
jgi:hypothetical protein